MSRTVDFYLTDALSGPATMQTLDLLRLNVLQVVERDIVGFDKSRTLAALGITEVPYTIPITSEVHGYSTRDSLAVTRASNYPTRILWHELAHILLAHSDRFKPGDPVPECEAELVAYILACHYQYGEAKAESRAYIQDWNKGGGVLDKLDRDRIKQAVLKIIEVNQ